jgi:4-amino-4-deoxy-L-arabinose transferase-like glycosyltransferase
MAINTSFSKRQPGGSRLFLVFLAVLTLVLLTYRLDGTPFRGLYDDSNRSLIARNMVDSGNWLVATFNDRPLHTKPPLMYWMAASIGKLTGRSDELPGNLTSAISMFLVVMATYWAGRNLFGSRPALWAGLLLVTMHLFLAMGRQALLDTVMMAGFALAFGSLIHLAFSGTPHQSRWWSATALGLGISFLTKGPVVLPVFLLIWIPLMVQQPRTRPGTSQVFLSVGLIALITLPWPIALLRQAPEAAEVWKSEFFGRFGDGQQFLDWTQKPFWFYLADLYNTLPWTLLLPWAVFVAIRERHDPRYRLLLWWAVGGLVFFSLASATKRSYYLLPIYPAFALIIAGGWDWLVRQARNEAGLGLGSRLVPLLCLGLLTLLGLGLAIAPFLLPLPDKAAFICCGVFTTIFSLSAIVATRRNSWGSALLLASVAAVFLHLAYFGHFVPAANIHHSCKPFFTEAGPIIGDQEVLVVDSHTTQAAFYLHRINWRNVSHGRLSGELEGHPGCLVITTPAKAAQYPGLEPILEREFSHPLGKKKGLGLYRYRPPQPTT